MVVRTIELLYETVDYFTNQWVSTPPTFIVAPLRPYTTVSREGNDHNDHFGNIAVEYPIRQLRNYS